MFYFIAADFGLVFYFIAAAVWYLLVPVVIAFGAWILFSETFPGLTGDRKHNDKDKDC